MPTNKNSFRTTPSQSTSRSRRSVLGFLIATPVAITARAADSSLLDPAAIRRKPASDDLLDPSAIGASKAGRTPTASVLPSSLPSPEKARNVAASTTNALRSLIGAYGGLCRKYDERDRLARDLAKRIVQLEESKEAKLEEYRQGLFCSGCGKTRSEILAKGESFPHPGQHVISATPEQIAAKERELNAEIDREKAREQQAIKDRNSVKPEIDEALNQIREGVAYWRTSVYAHKALVSLEESNSADLYLAEQKRIDQQINRIRSDSRTATRLSQLDSQATDLDRWLKLRNEGYRQREQTRLANQDRKLKGEMQARSERDRLVEFAQAESERIPDFNSSTILMAVVRTLSPGGVIGQFDPTPNTRGMYFRMGDHTPERKGRILPEVNTFITQVSSIPAARYPRIDPPSAESDLVSYIQNRIRTLAAKCESDPDSNCDT
jgi:predicted Fe-S protein YdhL (DUF1289 family)